MSFRAALVQTCAGRNPARNLEIVSDMIREANARGARFVSTPEMTNLIEPDRPRLRAIARSESEDMSVAGYAALARDLGLWLHVGSLALKTEGDRLVNRSMLFAPDGTVAARYDKIHLFDVDLPDGTAIRESAAFAGGDAAGLARLPWGMVGLTTCYDLRFPALYRSLAAAGADFIMVPSAFTVPTGEAHWHVLLRARAIETGSYVLAAAQTGVHESGRETYGHSLAVSPWGEIIAESGTTPQILLFDIDPRAVAQARNRIPVLVHHRSFGLKHATGIAT